jgi:DedD protein
MATSTAPDASEIRRRGRRRLLGAVTLVLLAVVFVPMILDNEPRPQRTEPALNIPNRELAKPLPQPAPHADSAASTPARPAARNATPEKPPAPAQEAARAPGAAPPPSSPSAPPKAAAAVVAAPTAPEAKAAATPKLEGFAVQVGAFRDEARLQQVRQKLEAAGVVHYIERVDSGGAAITRLRAGPFPTREAAENARETLHKAALDGQVVPLP